MAGIALLLPNEELMNQAEAILAEKKSHVMFVKQTTADTVVNEARNAIAEGANIVVARGHQAMEVKIYTKVPVVEIGITAQELGLTIIRARAVLNRQRPVIGIFSWKGMLCDTQYFEELFDVRIHRYLLEDTRPWGDLIEDALKDGIEFIIGGEQCVTYANRKGIPALHLSSTGESLRIAMENAENLYYMSEVEQHNYAQFSTVLDSSFNGILKISENGIVLLMNRVMEEILQIDAASAVGMHVRSVLEGLDEEILDKMLKGENDSYSTFINTSNQALVVIMESITVEGRVMGAIISCNRMRRLKWNDEETMREQFLRGNVARGSLNDLVKKYPDLKNVIDAAKLYAQSSSPLLIEGSYGREMDAVCQGIHNYSLRRDGPYVMVNLDSVEEGKQMKILFGEENAEGTLQGGVLSKANYGTLVIYNVEKLSAAAQHHLLTIINKRQMASYYVDNEAVQRIDVRIMACTSGDLREAARNGELRADLYYLLETFRITIPPLNQRKKDLETILDDSISASLNLYSRYHVLAAGARDAILSYSWEGNELQLKAFCERLVLTVGKRIITEEYVRFLLDDLYGPRIEKKKNVLSMLDPATVMQERQQLEEVLRKYNGSRQLTAKALGISTTTLWRKMKKYHMA